MHCHARCTPHPKTTPRDTSGESGGTIPPSALGHTAPPVVRADRCTHCAPKQASHHPDGPRDRPVLHLNSEGLRKMWATAAWRWSNSLANYPPGDFDPLVSFQDWGEGLDASSSYPADGASCVEITPYAPKAWNPFSCEVRGSTACRAFRARLATPSGSQIEGMLFASNPCMFVCRWIVSTIFVVVVCRGREDG